MHVSIRGGEKFATFFCEATDKKLYSPHGVKADHHFLSGEPGVGVLLSSRAVTEINVRDEAGGLLSYLRSLLVVQGAARSKA